MTKRKTLAIVMFFFVLAYVGVAFADEDEGRDEQNTNQEQQQERREKEREGIKQKFEQERERLKQEWEETREAVKNEREQFKEQLSERLKEKKNLLVEFKNKFDEDRCARIQEKVQERASHFDERENAHQKVYVNLVNRITKFQARFKAAGITTDTLDGYLVVLQTRIDQFSKDYASYLTSLKESKNLTCGHSEGEFKASLVDTKALLKTVHADAAEIRNYVRTVILPEMKVLKAQMPGEQDDENKEEEEKDENTTPDTTAPTVSITAPVDGSLYSTAQTITISADATDNDKVEKVEFYMDGVLIDKDDEAPYEYNWAITSANNGDRFWTAKAYDDAEPVKNEATSTAVKLTVTITP